MTEIQLGKSTVLFYSSVKELPIHLSKKMHAYLLQASGIGSTISDIDDRLEKLTLFLNGDKKEEAIGEAKNLRYALFSCISEISYRMFAFGCLVHSFNGVEVTDRSQEGMDKMLSDLSKKGLTAEKVEDILQEVKKNLIPKEDFISRKSLQTT